MRNNVSLSILRLFLRVAHERSFSAAAAGENVSQPALSRSIRMLEDQLGARLFDRDTRNVELTAAGAMLKPIALRLLNDYDSAFADLAQTLSGARGTIIVGALPSVTAKLLPQVLSRFQKERPQVEIKIEDALSEALIDMLQDRRIDFAVTIAPDQLNRVEFQPLIEDEFLLISRRGDPLNGTTPLGWGALAGAQFIGMAPASSVRRTTDAAFSRAGITVRSLYECANLWTVGGLISAGLGVSALPASTLSMISASDLSTRPLVDPIVSRTIGIVTLKGRTPSPPAEALMQAIGDAVRKEQGA